MTTGEAAGIGFPAIGLYYDFRNPTQWRRPWGTLYRSIIDQVVRAEREFGIDSVWISEHHLAHDGYTPSPLTLAAAIAVRTEHVRIGTSITILPLQHPVRLAEDALTVHALASGRFRLGVGLGYRAVEFAGLGVPLAERRGRLEEGLHILRAAFDGRAVEHRGHHYDLGRIHVTPEPMGDRPELWVGGFAPAAIRRAAPLADGMVLPIPELWPLYVEECRRAGRSPRVAAGYHWIVAEDPEAELNRVAPHLLHQINDYGLHGAYGPADQFRPLVDEEELRRFGLYELLDAEGAARRIAEVANLGYVEDVHWWTLFPGEPIEQAEHRLAYMAAEVLPRARLLAAGRGGGAVSS